MLMDLQPLCTPIAHLLNWNLYQFQQMLQSKTQQEAMFAAIRELKRRLHWAETASFNYKYQRQIMVLGACKHKSIIKGQD